MLVFSETFERVIQMAQDKNTRAYARINECWGPRGSGKRLEVGKLHPSVSYELRQWRHGDKRGFLVYIVDERTHYPTLSKYKYDRYDLAKDDIAALRKHYNP